MMKSLNPAVLALIILIVFNNSLADSPIAPWLKVGANASVSTSTSKISEYEATLKSSVNFKFEVLMREGIKAVIKARIEQILVDKGNPRDWQKLDFEKIVEEAFIQIETDKVLGLPRAVISVGKHSMAFGQGYSELPFFRQNLLEEYAEEAEVIGFTVTLPVNFLRMVDSLSFSLYENGKDDFKIADEKGLAIQITKEMSERLKFQASALIKENEGALDKETRGSIGVVYESNDGKYKVWFEGLAFDNNPELSETHFGGSLGASFDLGPGAVVIEYQYLQNQAQDLALAYNLPINAWLLIAPEIRIRLKDKNEPDDLRFGILAKINLNKIRERELKSKR